MKKIFFRPFDPHFREHSPIEGDPRHIKMRSIAGDLTRACLDFMHVYSWQLHHYQEQRMGYTTLQVLDNAAIEIADMLREATALAPTPEGAAISASVDLKLAEDAPTTYTPYLHYTDYFGDTDAEDSMTTTTEE